MYNLMDVQAEIDKFNVLVSNNRANHLPWYHGLGGQWWWGLTEAQARRQLLLSYGDKIVDLVKGIPEHNYEKYYELKKGDVFVDIGAYWCRYGLIACRKGCKVILIEPSPEGQYIINKIIDVEKLENIILINDCIGKERKKQKFVVSGQQLGHRLLESGGDGGVEFIEVNVNTLDNILYELGIEKVDLLAADCENAEVNMVIGAEKYFNEKRIKNVAIATYHSPDNHQLIIDILRKKDYDVRHDDGMVYGGIK